MTEESVPSLKKTKRRTALTPGFCEIEGCTWEYKIQRHRIIPGRDGGKYKALNVIALCPGHHWMADNEILSAEELLEIVEKRYRDGWPLRTDDEPSQNEQDTSERVEGAEGGGSNPAEEPPCSDGVSPPDATATEVGDSSS